MHTQQLFHESIWRLRALETPRISRHCPGCGTKRRFASSDRFRLNANGRRLDVWLIYRCTECDARWNREIHARLNPAALGDERYRLLLENDLATAWRWAFDLDGLRCLGVRVDTNVPVHIEPQRVTFGEGTRRIRFELTHPCGVRLDKLLAQGLGVPRSRITKWYQAGSLRVHHGPKRPLRQAVRPTALVEIERGVLVRPPMHAIY